MAHSRDATDWLLLTVKAVGGRLLAVGNAVGAGVGAWACPWGRVRAEVLPPPPKKKKAIPCFPHPPAPPASTPLNGGRSRPGYSGIWATDGDKPDPPSHTPRREREVAGSGALPISKGPWSGDTVPATGCEATAAHQNVCPRALVRAGPKGKQHSSRHMHSGQPNRVCSGT